MRSTFLVAAVVLSLASAGEVNWYQTGGDNDRLAAKKPLQFQVSSQGAAADGVVSVSIDRETSYQSIVGFGGALTQSSAYIYKQLPSEVQEELMTSYYSSEGRRSGERSDDAAGINPFFALFLNSQTYPPPLRYF